MIVGTVQHDRQSTYSVILGRFRIMFILPWERFIFAVNNKSYLGVNQLWHFFIYF